MRTEACVRIFTSLVAICITLQACRFNHGDVMRDVRPMVIKGEVQGIDLSEGLKVRLKDENKYYVLTDYCNGSICLKDQITFKDSLIKKQGEDVIYLKKKYGGEVSAWRLRVVK